MNGWIEGLPYLISWSILLFGIALLTISPKIIYSKIKTITINNKIKDNEIMKLTYKRMNLLTNEKLKDRQRLLDYYIVAGITITIIGFLLVLIFSNNLVLQNFK